MDGKGKARAAATIVLTLAAATSIVLMFTVGGAVQPAWIFATAGGWFLFLALSFWAIELMGRPSKAERLQMPVRPQSMAATSPATRAQTMPSSDGLVKHTVMAPSSLAHASLPGAAVVAESTVQLETEVAGTPVAAQPEGYVFRGFTLYERSQKGKPVRFFSKKGPVGGGRPTLLPDGYDVRWDGKHRRPILVPPKRVEPEEPDIPAAKPSKAPAPLPFEVPEVTAKPCSAMTSPGVFCNNAAKAGTLYCTRHAHYKPQKVLEPTIEVTHDRGGAKGKAPKFSLPGFEVHVDRATHKPLKAKKPAAVRLEIQADHAEHKAAKPIKPHVVEVAIRTDKPRHKMGKPVRPHEVQVEVHEDKVHMRPFELSSAYDPTRAKVVTAKGMPPSRTQKTKTTRCSAKLQDGRRCGNDARPSQRFCASHKNWRPTVELVVQHDNKARSTLGVGGASPRRGRKG